MSAPHSPRVQKRIGEPRNRENIALFGTPKPKKTTAPAPQPKPRLSRLERARAAVRRTRHPGAHLERELLCAEYNVPNTGRQWVRLRKRLAREERAAKRGGR